MGPPFYKNQSRKLIVYLIELRLVKLNVNSIFSVGSDCVIQICSVLKLDKQIRVVYLIH